MLQSLQRVGLLYVWLLYPSNWRCCCCCCCCCCGTRS